MLCTAAVHSPAKGEQIAAHGVHGNSAIDTRTVSLLDQIPARAAGVEPAV